MAVIHSTPPTVSLKSSGSRTILSRPRWEAQDITHGSSLETATISDGVATSKMSSRTCSISVLLPIFSLCLDFNLLPFALASTTINVIGKVAIG